MDPSKSVLIVEDEATIALDIQVRVEKMGFYVPKIISKPHLVISAVEKHKPHIVLMDINLNGEEHGIELAEEIILNYDIPVIYLTAFSDPKTFSKAIQTSPFGYVTKPFKDSDLRNTIEIALNQHRIINRTKEVSDRTFDLNPEMGNHKKSIFLKDGSGYLNIHFDEILWIRADDNYCRIVTQEQETMVNILLGDLEAKLPESDFIRIHRSYIVSLNKVNKVSHDVVIIGQQELPLSKSYKRALINRIS